MGRRRRWFVGVLGAGMVMTACGPAERRADEPLVPPSEIVLDPLHIGQVGAGTGQGVEVLDPMVLFEEGARAIEDRDYAVAARKYGLLLERFPDWEHRVQATYNGALAHEGLGEYEVALGLFRDFLRHVPVGQDALDARFHVGACEEGLGRFEDAATTFLGLLDEDLPAVDQVEALARGGHALFATGRFAEAEPRLEEAVRIAREDESLRAVKSHTHAALAALTLGDIYRGLCEELPLRLPMARMEEDLREKAALFQKAQDRYLLTLQFQHRRWSVAAGVRLGGLYERFREDLLAAEVPSEVRGEEARRQYEAGLQERLRPLLEKALVAYERTLELVDRLGAGEEWRRDTGAAVERLRESLGDAPR